MFKAFLDAESALSFPEIHYDCMNVNKKNNIVLFALYNKSFFVISDKYFFAIKIYGSPNTDLESEKKSQSDYERNIQYSAGKQDDLRPTIENRCIIRKYITKNNVYSLFVIEYISFTLIFSLCIYRNFEEEVPYCV